MATPDAKKAADTFEFAGGVPDLRSVKNELTYDAAKHDPSRDDPCLAAQAVAMQQALKHKGFDPGPMDGVIGPKPTAALKDYQKSENLAMTGKIDRDTDVKFGVKKVSAEKQAIPSWKPTAKLKRLPAELRRRSAR
jgi:peptidoglycan hydrolase-like protein with peptidoglycan-binding domain